MLRLFEYIAGISNGRARLITIVITIMVMTPWVVVTLGVATIFIVANRLPGPTIMMVAFPAMEVRQTVTCHRQPSVTGAQIVILVSDEADSGAFYEWAAAQADSNETSS